MARVQEFREVAVATPLGGDVLLLQRMSGQEEMGRLFTFELQLLSEDPQINFQDLLGQNMTVRVETMHGQTRYFNGFVSRFSQVGSLGRLTKYQATLVPWLWFLTRTADCHIFQNTSVPDIIEKIFSDFGFADVKNRLNGKYQPWEYCVQYRETAFDFISRLAEQEGIYYYFVHENGKHTLVLADGLSSHDPREGYEEIRYHREDDAVTDYEYVSDWSFQQSVQSGVFALNDFDFKSPKKSLRARATITRPHKAADFEIYDYPGEYTEFDDGEQYSRMRIQELHSQFETGHGQANARGIGPGFTFDLTEFPREDQCRRYLVTAARYEVESDEFDSSGEPTGRGPTYECEYAAIDSEESFRPARLTPLPRIRGAQTAIVVGQSGEEIYTDEYGRVKVQFHWDRYGKADENSSCWMRVAQVWAGKSWGAMYIPRIGQEVIVEFLEGDPDRPIITGRVYNGALMPPYTLPANKTMSTLKSNSSKGGEGFNEIRYEDKKGEEQIFIHAEKNQDNRVKNDSFEWIGNNRHLIVKKDQLEHVENNRSEKVDVDHMEEIGKDRHLKVGGKEAKNIAQSQSLTVGGDVIEVFKANHSEETTQNYYLKAMAIVIEGMQSVTLKVGTNSVVVDSAGVTVTGMKVTLDGMTTMINSGPGSPAGTGTAGSAVSPTAPVQAEEADNADPGEVAEIKAEQRQMKAGKYGAVQLKPFKPSEGDEEDEDKTWIEIELVDEDDKPMPGEKYRVETPDGSVAEGTLNEQGVARIEGIDPGDCKITFPNLDQEAWERA